MWNFIPCSLSQGDRQRRSLSTTALSWKLWLIYGLRRFQIYLQGKHFTVITDCNSLTLTLNTVELNPRFARWALDLQNYDYKVDHRSENKILHVDALNRRHVLIVKVKRFEDNLFICQSKDPNIQHIRD